MTAPEAHPSVYWQVTIARNGSEETYTITRPQAIVIKAMPPESAEFQSIRTLYGSEAFIRPCDVLSIYENTPALRDGTHQRGLRCDRERWAYIDTFMTIEEKDRMVEGR